LRKSTEQNFLASSIEELTENVQMSNEIQFRNSSYLNTVQYSWFTELCNSYEQQLYKLTE